MGGRPPPFAFQAMGGGGNLWRMFITSFIIATSVVRVKFEEVY